MAQDYIMRMVQQIAAMLAAIIAKRRAGQVTEAQQEIEAMCLQSIGLPLDTVRRMSPDVLAQSLLGAGANCYPRAVLLAELLIQDAEISEAQGEQQRALAGYLHAFCLLFDSMDVLSAEEQAVYRSKLAMLAAKLDRLPANPYVTQKLSAYQTSVSG